MEPIIIDCGSGVTKAGLANSNFPKTFPTIIGLKKYGNGKPIIGTEIYNRRGMLTLNYPIEHGIVKDWTSLELLWTHIFETELKLNPSEHPVLLSEPVLNPPKNSQTMLEILFEKYNVPASYIAVEELLSLYSSGRTTGLVLHCGDGVTSAAPIQDQRLDQNVVIRSNYGGRDITEYLKQLLTERGYTFTSSAEMEVVRDIKEKTCYIAENFEKETSSSSKNIEVSYELPDGQQITIGEERFRAPEAFFQSDLLGRKTGIHQAVLNSIKQLEKRTQEKLFGNVILSGGSSKFPGLAKRLQKELSELVQSTVKVNIIENELRKYSAWIGGSILVKIDSFKNAWITKLDYAEHGERIMKRKYLN